MVLRVLTWNLFHGRDFPPDPALRTWRSRLLRISEQNATHVQVNRPLLDEFATVLARIPWDLALLQEVPPRWVRPLGRRLGAAGASALTSRNLGACARAWLAERNPDLIASNEGGSNALLVRPPLGLGEVRRLTLARFPERRRLLWARVAAGGESFGAACMHLSAGRPAAAAVEVERAAHAALTWTGPGQPLVFGGDLNLRPRESPRAFARLAELGLRGATGPGAIDHLLVRGLEVAEPAHALPAEARELPAGEGRRLRLSDHAPVMARFVTSPPGAT